MSGDPLADAIARVQAADAEAEAADLAFASGNFLDYLAAQAKAASDRIEADYVSVAGNSGEVSGAGAGAGDSVSGGDSELAIEPGRSSAAGEGFARDGSRGAGPRASSG